MIRKLTILFCDNEHGIGDVTFPDLSVDLIAEIIKGNTIGGLRKEAKAAGWGRHEGGDYCPACMESGL